LPDDGQWHRGAESGFENVKFAGIDRGFLRHMLRVTIKTGKLMRLISEWGGF
jgi:hypothetical protein